MAFATVMNDDDTERTATDEWSADKLYRRGPEMRRVMFLELIAWAIHSVETIGTGHEWEAFKTELVETRKEVWGERPWPNATNQDAFLKHVTSMASVFAMSHAETGVKYEGRRTDPLAAAA